MTLDDIRAITGTSKSQIFHYFPNGKEELLLAVARYEADRVLDDQQPHLGALASWAAWKRWRDAVVARYRAQGRNCQLGALMGQVGSTPGAAEVVTTLLAQWHAHVERGITDMQAVGLVRGGLHRGHPGRRPGAPLHGEHRTPGGDAGHPHRPPARRLIKFGLAGPKSTYQRSPYPRST
ncbi:TetR/AcrR family transcriptional regulator [Actinoallomurus acanthiterrae]